MRNACACRSQRTTTFSNCPAVWWQGECVPALCAERLPPRRAAGRPARSGRRRRRERRHLLEPVRRDRTGRSACKGVGTWAGSLTRGWAPPAILGWDEGWVADPRLGPARDSCACTGSATTCLSRPGSLRTRRADPRSRTSGVKAGARTRGPHQRRLREALRKVGGQRAGRPAPTSARE